MSAFCGDVETGLLVAAVGELADYLPRICLGAWTKI